MRGTMGTNADDLEEEQEEEQEEEEQKPEESSVIRKLRKDLRAAQKLVKELGPVRETNAFLSAGLGNLSDDHKMALKAVVGDEFTAENLAAKAKILGFVSGDKVTDTESKEISEEIETINKTEQVVSSATAKPDNRDFVTKIKEAKSQDEIMALIASEGESHGLIIDEQ